MEAARQRSDTVSVGNCGLGSIPHVGLSQLEQIGAVRFNQIPLRGDGETTNSVLGKYVDAGAIGLTTASGKAVRILTVFSERRVPAQPEIPTMSELGVSIVTGGMVGMYACTQGQSRRRP